MTITTERRLTANGRDPGHCDEVRWCEQEPGHHGDHVREIDSLAVRGRRGPVILAIRQTGPTGVKRADRRVEFQVDDEIIALPDDTVYAFCRVLDAVTALPSDAVGKLGRALRVAAGAENDDL